MPNEGLIVPTHPKRITDLTGCRRSSLDNAVKPVAHNNHLVVPLMSSTNTHDPLHHHHHGASSGGGSYNGVNQGLNRIDPVAISLAAKAKRQQQQQVQQQQQQQRQTIVGSPSPKEQPPLSQININRRGSLDANVEYAVAMVNIVNPIYDMDDRDMCPFGTRRDSVCGNTNNNNNTNSNGISKKNDSPKRPRRRILKKASTEEQNNQINMLHVGNNNIVTCHHITMDGISAITAVATIPPTHRPMTKIATISQTDDYNLVRKHSNNNSNNNRPLTLSERIHFH